jgi:hypothetical protein
MKKILKTKIISLTKLSSTCKDIVLVNNNPPFMNYSTLRIFYNR